jgi:ribonucleoside-diphosphate reductase alpha chain
VSNVITRSPKSALSYFCGNELPTSVFLDKYALRDKPGNILEPNPNYMHWRIAREIARIEARKFKEPLTVKQIFGLIRDFKYIIPQGSPMFGIGNPAYVTLSNCYVIQPPYDSYAGIHYTDEQITQVSKRRGGCGTDVSAIRPVGMNTNNSSKRTTGLIPFMERFSNSIREVGQDGRRGALMLTCSVHHPEVSNFAEAKLDKRKITGANLSIRLSDEFLNAVNKGGNYQQRWPIESSTPEISHQVNATKVWRQIIRMAHTMAEPGLLFWDRIIRESPADCYSHCGFKTVSTNPCSELPLSILDSCRLLALNLFSFVANAFTSSAKFLFKKFYRYAQYAQRLMDDIIDLEIEKINAIIGKVKSDPEPDYIKEHEIHLWEKVKQACTNGRRTGTGIVGLGDVFAGLGLSYGSIESVKLTDEIYRTLKLGCYRASVDMAKELGPFPVFDADAENDNPFLLRIRDDDPELYKEMQEYGRRNIALLTTAPTGSVGIVAGPRPYFGDTGSGEPLFMTDFIRKKKINALEDIEPDEVDDLGDKWKRFHVIHPKLRQWMDVTGETDIKKSPYYGSCAEQINWRDRVKLQGVAQKHIDHAISSTINLPASATEEDVATIYTTAWKEECKGMTVYRKGCRDGVLVEKKESCPQCKSGNIHIEGKCVNCVDCGWSKCNL